MSVPRGLLGAGVLFWGWHAGLLAAAVAMAIVLEGSHWVRARWEVAPVGFQRTADFCTWAFLIEAGYLTFSKGMPIPILQIVFWLPVVLLPLLLVQLYSTAGRIELAALFVSLRRDPTQLLARTRVDFAVPYLVICALAAGTANVRGEVYYAGVAALAAWALWAVRRPRVAGPVWVLLAALAVGLGYAGHIGLSHLQSWVFNFAIDYLNADLVRTDPYRATTDIGHIGELKTSDRILLRVSFSADLRTPLLLHRASYNGYASTTWVARDAAFEPLRPRADESTWDLRPSERWQGTVTVQESLARGRSVVSLPAATGRITGLSAESVKRNALGTVQIERKAGATTYTALVAGDPAPGDAPTEHDRRVPAAELPVVIAVADALGLGRLAPQQAVAAIRRHFAQEFRYSTYQPARARQGGAIGDFLQHSRAGHCEYFATATVLLARAAGIPARYATGFSVQEWSDLEGRYIVRERHAHAWARVFLDGAWQDLDTTPPQWFAEEAKSASTWEPLRDGWAWLTWRIEAWRSEDEERRLPAWVLWALIPLFGALAWRVYRSGGFARTRSRAKVAPAHPHVPGGDSAFYRIEAHFAAAGLARASEESMTEWLGRLERAGAACGSAALRALLELHYRARFDPMGLNEHDRRALERGVALWFEQHARTRSSG